MLTPQRFGDALALGFVIRVATLLLRGHEDVVWQTWSAAARDVDLGVLIWFAHRLSGEATADAR